MMKIVKMYVPELVLAEKRFNFGTFSEEEMQEVVIPQFESFIKEFYSISGVPAPIEEQEETDHDTREFDSLLEPEEETSQETPEEEKEPAKKKAGRPKKQPETEKKQQKSSKPSDEDVIEGFLESSEGDVAKASFKFGMYKKITLAEAREAVERYQAGERLD